MPDIIYDTIQLDSYGRLAIYKVDADTDSECGLVTKTVSQFDDTTITPISEIDTTINGQISTKCGNTNTSDLYERFPNHNSTTVTITVTTLADPAVSGNIDKIHQKYFVWAGSLRLEYGTSTSDHGVYRISGQNILLNTNPRGQNIIFEKRV